MSGGEELAPPLFSEIGKARSSAGKSPDEGSEEASEPKVLEDPERLPELRESLGRLEDIASQGQAENTTRVHSKPGQLHISLGKYLQSHPPNLPVGASAEFLDDLDWG